MKVIVKRGGGKVVSKEAAHGVNPIPGQGAVHSARRSDLPQLRDCAGFLACHDCGTMFTGLVEETGAVIGLAENKTAWRLRLRAKKVPRGLRVGDSLAVNGCCLTVARKKGRVLEFDLLEETLRRTNLGDLRKNSPVNLERSVARNGRFGGHFVTGHIDCAGTVKVFRRSGKNYYLLVSFPKKFGEWVVEKGSIAIDGVSLTIAEAGAARLAVWLIPHSLSVTNLCALKSGARVNLEFDLLAKYAERMAGRC